MNKVMLLGRFTKDPDFRQNEVNENSSFCRFNLAVDRPFAKGNSNSQPTADFIGCICFGKTAEFINKYFHKGDPIIVEGRIQTGSYEKNGQRVYTTDVLVDRTEFVPKSNNSGDQGSNNYGARDASEKRRDEYKDIPSGADEELPFS